MEKIKNWVYGHKTWFLAGVAGGVAAAKVLGYVVPQGLVDFVTNLIGAVN